MKCDKRGSVAEHLHNLSPFSLHCMIEVLYILSRLGSICLGLASAEAWHATLYLVVPWQYLPRLGMLLYILSRLVSICLGLAFYANILSRLGSICRGSVFCSKSFHSLAVYAEAWHAPLYLITPCSICLGLASYANILSRLGSICLSRLICILYLITSFAAWENNPGLPKPRLPKPELQKLKLNKQRHAGVLE